MSTEASPSERFLRLPEVRAQTGLSRTEIYRRISAKTFPAGHRISWKIAVWYQSEIDAWKTKMMNEVSA